MVKFDFIESATDGYKFAWAKRDFILQLALVPLLVKVATLTLIISLNLEENYIRQGLIALPSAFVEGWFLCAIIRLAILGESWPASLTGETKHDQALELKRHTGLLGGTILYTLIKLVTAVMVGGFMTFYVAPTEGSAPTAPPIDTGPIDFYFVALVAFAAMIWAFRYQWLYVPVALGYDMRSFLERIFGFGSSFRLMATWMICFMPLIIVLILLMDGLRQAVPNANFDDPGLILAVLISLIQSAMELLMLAVTSIAIATGVYEVMEGKRL